MSDDGRCGDNRSFFDCNWPDCSCRFFKKECEPKAYVTPTPTLSAITPLYEKIKHGSAAHRQWLWDAFVAWSRGEETPPPYE